jgi:hypothetical protein
MQVLLAYFFRIVQGFSAFIPSEIFVVKVRIEHTEVNDKNEYTGTGGGLAIKRDRIRSQWVYQCPRRSRQRSEI